MKKFYFLACMGLLFLTAKPQSQGPYSPTAAVSVSSPQGTPWNNATNVFVADIISASCTMPGYPACTGTSCYYSQAISATGFGFSIPANASIKGIVVDVKRRSTNFPAHVNDSTVKLLKAGLPVGVNKADTTKWGLSYIYVAHGDSIDLWGTAWTPADINDPNFGVYFSAMVGNNLTGPPQVDHIRATVYYDTATTAVISPSIKNTISIFPNPVTDLVTVEMNFTGPTEITIVNIVGEELLSDKIYVNKKVNRSISVSTLPNGIYFLNIKNEGKTYVKKFIKQ